MQTDSDDRTPASLTAVLDCLPHPTILVGHDLTIEAANQRFRSVYGGGEEIRGRPCHEVSHGSSRPCNLAGEECPLLSSRRSGRTRRALHVHVTPRGLEHVEVIVRPVCGAGGKVTAFVESLRTSTIASTEPTSDRLVGRSPAFNRMLEEIERVAPADSSVVLEGESGSGREAVARALHELSQRSSRPFVAVDCSGARERWFEMELFGGAGAGREPESGRRQGILEAVGGGTVYLNEIGELPTATQARLLRTLETGTLRRLGESRPVPTDFRLVCSTSCALRRLIEERRFMPELLLGIGALTIRVPSLRERLGDLQLLIDAELERLEGYGDCRLGAGTLAAMSSYAFPGNLRELRAVLQYACVFAEDGIILPEHLPQRIGEGRLPRWAPLEIDHVIPCAELEQRYLAWASRRVRDRRSLCRKLGCTEDELQRKLRKPVSV